MSTYRFIISGGGTGGHIFPAISIANELKARYPGCDILFVGALGRMEMERVPQAGYPIEGLPVQGFDRKRLWRNFKVLVNLVRSTRRARRIVRDFRPHVAIGVGGYASAPTLKAAAEQGVPCLLQEQNSYAGVTNQLLASKAARICVAYEGMERFFPKDKIVLTGNPVRQDLFRTAPRAPEAYEYFGLDPAKPVLLVVGGSLGARTLNRSVMGHLDELAQSGVQLVWQTGKFYIDEARRAAAPHARPGLVVTDFVARMDYAYAVADLVVSRAGAGSISELCLLAKPVILVPSPNVAEDHQTKNAQALVRHDAAVMIPDADAPDRLVPEALALVADRARLADLSAHIATLAQHDSAARIADEVARLLPQDAEAGQKA